MSRSSGPVCAVLVVISLLSISAATEVHVSPAGNDANAGSALQPVATPQRARDLVRGRITGGLSEPVEVIFAAGTYTMGAALELRPEDSGTVAFPITWKAAAGANVVLDGGKLNRANGFSTRPADASTTCRSREWIRTR